MKNVLGTLLLIVIIQSYSFSQGRNRICEPPCPDSEVCYHGACVSKSDPAVEWMIVNTKEEINYKTNKMGDKNENPYIRPIAQLIIGPLLAVAGTSFLIASSSETFPVLASNYRIEGAVFLGVSVVFDVWAINQIMKRRNWEKNVKH